MDGLEPPDLLITNQLLYRLSYISIYICEVFSGKHVLGITPAYCRSAPQYLHYSYSAAIPSNFDYIYLYIRTQDSLKFSTSILKNFFIVFTSFLLTVRSVAHTSANLMTYQLTTPPLTGWYRLVKYVVNSGAFCYLIYSWWP